MAPPLLTLQDVHLTFGGTPLLTGADLTVMARDRICLVGRNGSGKSTLLKITAGLEEMDSGERFAHPGASMRYLPQEVDFSGFETTQAYAEAGLGPADDPYRVSYLLHELGLSGDEDPARLSGGEARRASLARVLAPQADIILLDEPTNHLDLPAIEWLESELASMRCALLLISHDRRFLENLSRATVWLDRGVTHRLGKGFAHFESWRDEKLECEETARHKLDRKIAAEEHWIRYGVSGRRKRNVRRVDELAALRAKKRDARHVQGNVEMKASEGEISGKLVVEAKGLRKAYGDKTLVSNLSIRIARGDRIGILGPNGAGKTTLLQLLTGELEPDAGTIRLGANLQRVLLDQRREDLDPDMTLGEAISGGGGNTVMVGGVARHVVGYMKDFLFAPEQVRTPLHVLSGGERGRLMLARALAKPSNLLVLDEPTNDLDLETLDLLQELLAGYKGTVILISHDRDFIDRVVTSVVAFEGEGRWVEYAGGYSDMLTQRKAAAKAARQLEASATKGDGKTEGKLAARSGAGGERSTAPTTGSQKVSRKKMTFKDSHALKTLPETMEKLQGDIIGLEAKMAKPDFYARDPAAFDATATRLGKTKSRLVTAEEEWLRLEMVREEIEGN